MTKPLTIYGLDGSSLDDNLLRAALDGLVAHRYPDLPDDDSAWREARSKVIPDLYAALAVAAYHNTLVGLIDSYRTATTAARIAVANAVEAYNELTARTTTAWHAAHHRYILAITAAEEALTAKCEAADLLTAHHTRSYPGHVAHFYDRLVPEADRRTLPLIDDVVGDLVLFRLKHAGHLRMLSYTITGAIPQAFKSEPVEPAKTPVTKSYSRPVITAP